ncbi:MAG: methyltransferase domain-containing protein [Candidatus Margulisbacteria bacterium]|nr:methyltransferase domain-containing protein [Candidatus Margulisiibacteriota bacterium]
MSELLPETSVYITNDTRQTRWAIPYSHEATNARANILLYKNKKHIKDKAVLDLGCHFGTMTSICSSLGAKKIVGIDGDGSLIKQAKNFAIQAKSTNVEFIKQDVIEYLTNLAENSFDTILCFGLLYYIPDNFHLLKLMKKVAKEAIILDTFTAYYNIIQGKDGPKYFQTLSEDALQQPLMLHSITKAKKQKHYELEQNTFKPQPKQNPLTLLTCPTKQLLELYFQALNVSYKQLNWEKHLKNPKMKWQELEPPKAKTNLHWSDIYSTGVRVSYLIKK